MQAYIADTYILPGERCKVYFAGCNFNCPFCNTGDILSFSDEFLKEVVDVKKDLLTRHDEYKEIIFTGGEPTLQKTALYALAKHAKEHKKKVIVETNGSKPDVLQHLMRAKLVDEVRLDLKAPPQQFERATRSETFFIRSSELLSQIGKSIELLKRSAVAVEIRSTIVPSILFRKEDLLLLAKSIKDIRGTWRLQQYKSSPTVKDKRFVEITSPSISFMQNLRSVILEKYPNMSIIIEEEL